MRKMDLVAIYPKPKTSKNGKPSKKYPYLLKDSSVTRPDQVWAVETPALSIWWLLWTGILDMCYHGNCQIHLMFTFVNERWVVLRP